MGDWEEQEGENEGRGREGEIPLPYRIQDAISHMTEKPGLRCPNDQTQEIYNCYN